MFNNRTKVEEKFFNYPYHSAFFKVRIAVDIILDCDLRHFSSVRFYTNLDKRKNLMKALKIQFMHPVQGRIQLRKKEMMNKVKSRIFRSDEDFTVDINTKDLTDGDWTASLEWNHDNQPFFLEKHFRVIDENCVQ